MVRKKEDKRTNVKYSIIVRNDPTSRSIIYFTCQMDHSIEIPMKYQ